MAHPTLDGSVRETRPNVRVGEESASVAGHGSAGESVPVAQAIAECVGKVSANAAQTGLSRRRARTFPRKRAPTPDQHEILMRSLPLYPVFQIFLNY
jgi:hypothetical protein